MEVEYHKRFDLFFLQRYKQMGAEIFKKALSYPTRLIAKNAGTNGNIVIEKVLINDNVSSLEPALTN